MSKGPPDMMTRITGPLDAFATAVISWVCWPGRRRLTRSRLSLSIDWSAPTIRTVTSACAAACFAGSNCKLLPEHPTSAQPGW